VAVDVKEGIVSFAKSTVKAWLCHVSCVHCSVGNSCTVGR